MLIFIKNNFKPGNRVTSLVPVPKFRYLDPEIWNRSRPNIYVRVSICMRVCVYVYNYIHTHVHTYTCVCVSIYLSIYVCVCVHNYKSSMRPAFVGCGKISRLTSICKPAHIESVFNRPA